MTQPIKVALAGAGAFGIKHLDGIRNIDGVKVVSLVSRDLDKTREVADKYGIGHVTTELATMPHIEYVREAGSEGIELVMWLIARGAMSDVAGSGQAPKVAHRFFHVPASNTAVGHLILENQV